MDDDDVEVAMELAKDADGDTIEQRVLRTLRNEVVRLRGEQDIVHVKSGIYYENHWDPMVAELKRYREREPLVQALLDMVARLTEYYDGLDGNAEIDDVYIGQVETAGEYVRDFKISEDP
jgi:hypothetical protein